MTSPASDSSGADQTEITPGTWLRWPLWKVAAGAVALVVQTAILVYALSSINAAGKEKNTLQDSDIKANTKAIDALELKFATFQSDVKKDVGDIKDKLGTMNSSLVEIKTTLQFIAPKPKATMP